MAAEPETTPLHRRRGRDPWYVRYLLVGLTLGVVGLLVLVPLVNVFSQALATCSPTRTPGTRSS